jgi:hypothetical protein
MSNEQSIRRRVGIAFQERKKKRGNSRKWRTLSPFGKGTSGSPPVSGRLDKTKIAPAYRMRRIGQTTRAFLTVRTRFTLPACYELNDLAIE